MKKAIVLLLIVAGFGSCTNETESPTNGAPHAAVNIGTAGEATVYKFVDGAYTFLIVSKPGCVSVTKY